MSLCVFIYSYTVCAITGESLLGGLNIYSSFSAYLHHHPPSHPVLKLDGLGKGREQADREYY